jgi:hypothetical protein
MFSSVPDNLELPSFTLHSCQFAIETAKECKECHLFYISSNGVIQWQHLNHMREIVYVAWWGKIKIGFCIKSALSFFAGLKRKFTGCHVTNISHCLKVEFCIADFRLLDYWKAQCIFQQHLYFRSKTASSVDTTKCGKSLYLLGIACCDKSARKCPRFMRDCPYV